MPIRLRYSKPLLLSALFLPLLAHAVPRYSVTMLGPLHHYGHATGISDNGLVSGYIINGDKTRAMLYTGSKAKDLGDIGGPTNRAQGVNAAGAVVGSVSAGSQYLRRAFLYTGGVLRDLGAEGKIYAYADAINNSGAVVGSAEPRPGHGVVHAFIWSGNGFVDLGTLGGKSSYAKGINDAGAVVGSSAMAGEKRTHAFLYADGKMKDLGTLGGKSAEAVAINNANTVVGSSMTASGDFHAFADWGQGMVDLGSFGGFSEASGINNLGQIVGQSNLSPGTQKRAFLYADGVMTDLNTLARLPAGWVLTHAAAINDRQQIAASVCNSTRCHPARLDLIVAAADLAVAEADEVEPEGAPGN